MIITNVVCVNGLEFNTYEYKWEKFEYVNVNNLYLHKIYTSYIQQLLTLTHTTLVIIDNLDAKHFISTLDSSSVMPCS
jgi:hypothetical protein